MNKRNCEICDKTTFENSQSKYSTHESERMVRFLRKCVENTSVMYFNFRNPSSTLGTWEDVVSNLTKRANGATLPSRTRKRKVNWGYQCIDDTFLIYFWLLWSYEEKKEVHIRNEREICFKLQRKFKKKYRRYSKHFRGKWTFNGLSAFGLSSN